MGFCSAGAHRKCWVIELLLAARAEKGRSTIEMLRPSGLFDFPATFLPVAFSGQCLLYAKLFTWFQVKRMSLYFFDDVFLLHFALEPAQCVFQSFTILESYFSQTKTPPN